MAKYCNDFSAEVVLPSVKHLLRIGTEQSSAEGPAPPAAVIVAISKKAGCSPS